jgi:hypothetical protein
VNSPDNGVKERLPDTTVRPPAQSTTIITTIMMRPLLIIAAMLGVLSAVPAAYFLTAPARQGLTVTPAGPDTAAESWPICSTMAMLVETPDWAVLDPDFAAGKRAIAEGDWDEAIEALTSAGLRDARNADIQNFLGYAYRRLRRLDPAMQHYRQALALNPRHRSAHEHLGEAYLAQGEPAKAREHLGALEQICLIPCDELDDLKRAIAEYNKLAKR